MSKDSLLSLVYLLLMAGSCNLQEESFSLKEAERNYSYIHMNRFSGKMFFDYFSAENMAINDSRAVFDTLSGGVIVQRCEDEYVFQGDMLYSDSTLYRLLPANRSSVNDEPKYYWPNRTVYYTFQYIPDTTEIKAAMSSISAVSSLTFLPRPSGAYNYIKFKYDANINASAVGMQGGCQTIKLHDYFNETLIKHEIMHALGMRHELCRTDRDYYVIIDTSNIKDAAEPNFYIYEDYRTADVGTFDFNSIMMYPSFTSDLSIVENPSLPIFTKIDGSYVVQSSVLSPGDIEGLKSIYGPPFHRVERRMTVTNEDYYGLYEILEMDGYDYVLLYADANCTTRAASLYPRQLWIEKTVETYSYGSYQGISSQLFEVTIPVGTDSLFLGSYHNVENYASGNPYNISITQYNIVNSHVPSYTHPIL